MHAGGDFTAAEQVGPSGPVVVAVSRRGVLRLCGVGDQEAGAPGDEDRCRGGESGPRVEVSPRPHLLAGQAAHPAFKEVRPLNTPPAPLLTGGRSPTRQGEEGGSQRSGFIQHGAADTLIAPAHAEALAKAARTPTLQLFEGVGHDLSFRPEAQAAQVAWLATLPEDYRTLD